MAGLNQGLTPNEVVELINYIQKYNSWQAIMDACKKRRRIIKYYDMSFDTRSGEMWYISFRVPGKDPVEFRDGPTFKEDIYKYLNEEV